MRPGIDSEFHSGSIPSTPEAQKGLERAKNLSKLLQIFQIILLKQGSATATAATAASGNVTSHLYIRPNYNELTRESDFSRFDLRYVPPTSYHHHPDVELHPGSIPRPPEAQKGLPRAKNDDFFFFIDPKILLKFPYSLVWLMHDDA